MTNANATTSATEPTNHQLEVEAVAAYGNTNQCERYAAGMLPEDELLGIVRPLLFNPFHELPRWSTSRDRERMIYALRRKHACDGAELVFETTDTAELSADEWAILKAINAAAEVASRHAWVSVPATVQTSSHWVTCPTCNAEVVRISAKVTIHWAGRSLVREYAL